MWFFTHVWIIPALMALSFLLILLFGKRLPRKGSEIGIVFIGAAFVLALFTAGNWIAWQEDSPEGIGEVAEGQALGEVDEDCSRVASEANAEANEEAALEGEGEGHSESGAEGSEEGARGASSSAAASTEGESAAVAAPAADEKEPETITRPVARCVTWFDNGDSSITIGTLVDGQSVLLLVVVTLISLLVHIFSTDYVGGDRRYTHYFAFLSLFTASMLFFVLSENTLQMIVGWELVGVCSFALIGHWWEEKPNSDAALKAFITNRVGDVGLLVGVIVLYFAADRSFSILDINILATEGGIRQTVLLAASLALITAVMSKSGQFILHTWLPDAMAGPTPVSALIHAATMVVAGIYMIARLYPVFFEGLQISGSSINALAVVGAVTALFGALLAFVQKDIKKVLAYSTVSQLGFMVTSLGIGAWTAAMFHLFTHAMFKACLFLGAGSLSHACHHSFNMVDDMGGLRKIMPKTFWTYLIATGALAGIFPLSGFWSKDEIVVGTGSFPGTEGANGTYHLMLVMLLLAAFCTAAYMTRTIWYAFYGEYRGHGTPARVRAPHHRPADHPRHARRDRRRRQPAVLARPVREVPLRVLRRAGRPLLPRDLPRRVPPGARRVLRRGRPRGHRPDLRLLLQGRLPGSARPERAQRARRLGQERARQQVLLRLAVHHGHRRVRQGPARPGGQLDQHPHPRRRRQRRRSGGRDDRQLGVRERRPDRGRRSGELRRRRSRWSGWRVATDPVGPHPAVRSVVLRRRSDPHRCVRGVDRLMTSRESRNR